MTTDRHAAEALEDDLREHYLGECTCRGGECYSARRDLILAYGAQCRAEALNEPMRVLADLEWIMEGSAAHCPMCLNYECFGHWVDCRLAKVLAPPAPTDAKAEKVL